MSAKSKVNNPKRNEATGIWTRQGETEGDEDIRTQLLKLSEDTWIVPEEQLVPLVIAVIEVVSIASEK